MKPFEGLLRARLWWSLALEDIRGRYMRSFFGISWVVISFALFVFVKTVIFTPLSDEDVTFFAPYVTIGFFVWNFLSASLMDGCVAFIGAQNWIKGIRMPLTVFVYQSVAKNTILACLNLFVVLAVMIFVQTPLTLTALWSLPICLLIVFNAVWVTLLLGTIGARFRDFVHLVTTIMRVMVFLTPIFWLPEQMGRLWDILVFNPLAHYIILLRDPLLLGTIPWVSLYVVLGMTVAGWILAISAFLYSRNRIVFWL